MAKHLPPCDVKGRECKTCPWVDGRCPLTDKKFIMEGGNKMEFLLKLVLPVIMSIIGKLLSPENIQLYGDKLFDLIEEFVKDSETTIDDVTILPVIKALRIGLNIPDND